MTVIAARVFEAGGAQLAADSRVNLGSEYMDGMVKAWQLGGALVGIAGPSTHYATIETFRVLPDDARPSEISAWCADLFSAMRGAAVAMGQVYRNQDGTDSLDMALLVATRHGLWTIHTDGAVLQIPRAWHAIGSGGAEARGALQVGVSAARAVEAAIALDSNCGGPITLRMLDAQSPTP